MNTVLFHKFTQHNDLKRELLSTGAAELIEVRVSSVEIPQRELTSLGRTRTKMRSGGVERMEREGMSLGGLLNVSVLNYVRRSGDDRGC